MLRLRALVRSRCTRFAADEVVRVTYFVYMEGCDDNCSNEAQSRDISLQFAFAATRA